ncbi:hypothetical protein FRC01_013630, partial [Tulasnella sp. 417]
MASTGRTTRAATRALATGATRATPSTPAPSLKRKKSLKDNEEHPAPAKKKAAVSASRKDASTDEQNSDSTPTPSAVPVNSEPAPKADVIPATLSFDWAEAKAHLINADSRFEKLFSKLKCRPYQELDAVEPFQTLASSILGQQISWKAARSIKHKFIRLFDPSLPETPPAPGD